MEVKESTLQAAQQAQRAGANKQLASYPAMDRLALECRPKFSKPRVVQAEQNPNILTSPLAKMQWE